MKMKLVFFVMAIFLASVLSAQKADQTVINSLLSAYSERVYTTEPVTDEQLDLVLKCGIKAPSARNQQPWKFTVIRDEAVVKEIVRDAVAGNVLIVVSGLVSESGSTPDFDCALATQNMFVAAHGLGLGARIYGSPTRTVNADPGKYQIPAGYKAVIILRIGSVGAAVDAVTAASARKSQEEVVNYYK